MFGPLASALDTDAELADLYQFKATRTYTTKPYISSFRNADVMKAAIEMGIVSSGNLDNFKRNPNLLVYIESCSPLTLSQKTIEQLLLAAEYGVPVVYVSQIVPGSTGQADLFNSLAQANADCLAGLAIHQLKQNGAPFVMGIIAGQKIRKAKIMLSEIRRFPYLRYVPVYWDVTTRFPVSVFPVVQMLVCSMYRLRWKPLFR